MKKINLKRPDFCQLAAAVVKAATEETPETDIEDTTKKSVASGRRGGKIGKEVRAEQ
jgi:hypothetical protein